MAEQSIDVVIVGAGGAGLWTFHRLKALGYDVLLLERDGIGGIQSLGSQGIIHSGLKYALAGKVNALAKAISKMPERWLNALDGEGEVDLSAAKQGDAVSSQCMLIPPGLMGETIKMVSKQALGNSVTEIASEDWPDEIKASGFKGTVLNMAEPVLDMSQIIRTLAEPYMDCIRKIGDEDPFEYLEDHGIQAKKIVLTAAGSNHKIARTNGHDEGLKTQIRPLLMAMLKPAPFPAYMHFVGPSEKPVTTITTHKDKDGTLVWYMGGLVAERKKEDDPNNAYKAAKKAMAKFMPHIDISHAQWGTFPVDRVEGKSGSGNWMPDTPTIHECGNVLYGWPTKLAFAPMLSDEVLARINFEPSHKQSDFSALPEVGYAVAPWDKAIWTKDN